MFDPWGQGFVGDGTSAQQHWDSPLSRREVSGRRGMDPVFNNQGMRPCVGSEFLFSRQFPDDVQGQFIYACVINMNGMPRFNVRDESAGFAGERVMQPRVGRHKDGKPFRTICWSAPTKTSGPVDPQIGPDGALWFGDWCNALIGHMQYSQRDPNRDHLRGRIYRLVYTKKKLLEPVTQFGKSEAELLDQLREYEPRTRYRARRELRDRPTAVVLAAVAKWVAALDKNDPEYDRLRCEALWALQSHHAVDQELLLQVLESKTSHARAAAMHVVADERDYLPNAFELLQAAVRDEHPRVRLEAIRGLSFFHAGIRQGSAAVLELPTDSWIDYTLEHTLAALEPHGAMRYQDGKMASDNESAKQFIEAFVAQRRAWPEGTCEIKKLLKPETPANSREKAYASLETMHGDESNGRSVFTRTCVSCHKVGDSGYTFGPRSQRHGQASQSTRPHRVDHRA